MRKLYLPFALIIFFYCWNAFATTHIITNTGYTFLPSTINISVNDTIKFQLMSMHDAVEVSKATWDAGNNTKLPGGFAVPFGGGICVITTPGVHYYVCEPHASLGMKGTITATTTGVETPFVTNEPETRVSPNPSDGLVNISYNSEGEDRININLFDLTGRKIAELLQNQMVMNGINAYSFDLSGKFNRGLYYLEIIGNQKSSYLKLIIN